MANAFVNMFNAFLNGGAPVVLGGGNQATPAVVAPINGGAWQWLPTYAYQGVGHEATDIQPVPPNYRDWGQYPVNFGGISGPVTATNGSAVVSPTETDLYFDTGSGLYYDLGSTTS